MLAKYRLLLVNGILALVLLGGWMGRRLEASTVADPKFLERLELPFRDWKAQPMTLTASEMELLEPDAVLARHYAHYDSSSPQPKEFARLVVIAGHRKKSIHTPAYCMAGSGWETTAKSGAEIHLPNRTIRATRMLMTNEGKNLLVTFFFTDGEYCSDSLPRFQAMQLLKRFRSNVPVGALVRIETPASPADTLAAEKLSDEFASAVVPPVIEELAKARLIAK